MSEQDNVKFVRALWAAIEGGLEPALRLTEPGVEWRPHAAGGRVLTSEELLKFFDEFQGERQLLEARPYSFHARGDSCSPPGASGFAAAISSPSSRSTSSTSSRQGKLVRATTYATRNEAVAAMNALSGG